MIDKKRIQLLTLLFWLIPFEALIALISLFILPKEAGQASLFGFSTIRLLMAAFLFAAAVIMSLLLWIVWKRPETRLKFAESLERQKWAAPVKWISSLVAALLFTVFATGLILFPAYQPVLARLLPLGSFLIITCLEIFLITLYADPAIQIAKWIGALFLIAVTITALLLFLQGAFSFSVKINHSPAQGASDQLAYMSILKTMHDNHSYLVGDYFRQPLFFVIESIFYKSSNSYNETFLLAKNVNIYLSLVFLIGYFIFFYKTYHSLFSAVNLLLIATFSIYIFKAGYFTVESVLYFFLFVSFFCMVRMFIHPTKWMAVLTGISTGLAYLTKASALPAMVCFLVIWLLWMGWKFWRAHSQSAVPYHFKNDLILGSLAVVLFVLVILPVGIQNIRSYGGFFRNGNSDAVMWLDSWDSFQQFRQLHPDITHLPADIQPGLSSYIKSHTLQQVVDRFSYGLGHQFFLVTEPFNLFSYPLILLSIVGITGLFRFTIFKKYLVKYWPLAAFTICYVVGYLISFGWFSYIDAGPRFVMGLYLPVMFLSYQIFLKMESTIKPVWRSIRVCDLVNLFLIALISVDAWVTLSGYLLSREFGY